MRGRGSALCVLAYLFSGKTISHVVITLKTVKGSKSLRLDPTIYESLQKEKVNIGDVIYIEANSGAVKVFVSRDGATRIFRHLHE